MNKRGFNFIIISSLLACIFLELFSCNDKKNSTAIYQDRKDVSLYKGYYSAILSVK